MKRRDFITSAAGLCLWAGVPLSLSSAIAGLPATALFGRSFLVPGYFPEAFEGHFRGADGRDTRLITRVTTGGQVDRAQLPVKIHAVAVSPHKDVAIACGFEGREHVAFDPSSLHVVATETSGPAGWRGGGHAAYDADGAFVVTTERSPRKVNRNDDVTGRYGRLTLRDAHTLKPLENFSTYGIDPHDVCLADEGRYAVVANYGSLPGLGSAALTVPRNVVESCVTIIDMNNGKLVDKYISYHPEIEMRHLVVGDGGQIFVIQAHLAAADLDANAPPAHLPHDITLEAGTRFLAAPTLMIDAQGCIHHMGAKVEGDMQQGLSIVVNPLRGHVIATYPSAHRVMIFHAVTGALITSTNTLEFGLAFPAGVAVIDTGAHYAVSGYWAGLYIFDSETHQPVPGQQFDEFFFGHSHLAVI